MLDKVAIGFLSIILLIFSCFNPNLIASSKRDFDKKDLVIDKIIRDLDVADNKFLAPKLGISVKEFTRNNKKYLIIVDIDDNDDINNNNEQCDEYGFNPFEIGDQIISFDGQKIYHLADLLNLFNKTSIGRVVKFGVIRGNTTIVVEKKIHADKISELEYTNPDQSLIIDGYVFTYITEKLRKEFKLAADQKGIICVASQDSHIKKGDVILSIQSNKITSLEQLKQFYLKLKVQSKKIVILVERKNHELFILLL